MKSITKRISRALQKEFIEGTVYRVDLDRVDVAPSGSTGILRGLPLTGDRDKIKPGDPVKIITVGGERVALASDIAMDATAKETIEDASYIQLAELLANYARSATDGSQESSSVDILSDGWTLLDTKLTSTNWSWQTISTASATQLNVIQEFGLPSGVEAVLMRVEVRDSGTWGSPTGQNIYFGVGPDATNAYSLTVRTYGNDIRSTGAGIVKLDAEGYAYWQCSTSGTGTMDVFIDIWGYKLPVYEVGGVDPTNGQGWALSDTPILSASWDGATVSSNSTPAAIDFLTEYSLPSGTEAVLVRMAAKDTASAAAINQWFALSSVSTVGAIVPIMARTGGVDNNCMVEEQGIIKLDSNGRVYWTAATSGTNSMTVYIRVVGYLLPISVERKNAQTLAGYEPKQTASADAHIPVTDGNGKLSVANITGIPTGFSFIIEGGGSVITAGMKGVVHIPFNMVITRVAFYSQESGSATVQLCKFNSHSGWPASDYVNFGDHVMTSAQKIEWTGLNYTLNAGNFMRFWVQGTPSGTKNLSIHLSGYRA